MTNPWLSHILAVTQTSLHSLKRFFFLASFDLWLCKTFWSIFTFLQNRN